MSTIVTAKAGLQQIAPPNLPRAPAAYNSAAQDRHSDVLRLYFIRLQGIVNQLQTDSKIIPPTTLFAVADLPDAVDSGAGARAFVSNALAPTFGATVVGGGAVVVPVYSDGANWKVG